MRRHDQQHSKRPGRHRLATAVIIMMTVFPFLTAATAHAAVRWVTVRPGDTLSGIARAWCGSAADWPGLLAANRTLIVSPDVIRAGWRLRIQCSSGQARARTVSAVSIPATGFEACVIARESGGNPRAVNPVSGAGGLYGFLPRTWAALGFSGLPENASAATQHTAFTRAYALWGTSPWAPYDGCTA